MPCIIDVPLRSGRRALSLAHAPLLRGRVGARGYLWALCVPDLRELSGHL